MHPNPSAPALILSLFSVSSLCALAHRWLRGVLADYVSSVWYLLNTSCCPWPGKHARVINLPSAHVYIYKSGQIRTYLHTDIDRNTHVCNKLAFIISTLLRRLPQACYTSEVSETKPAVIEKKSFQVGLTQNVLCS